MEIPASARGADSSWTLAPDLSGRKGEDSWPGNLSNALTNAVRMGINLQNVPGFVANLDAVPVLDDRRRGRAQVL